MSKELFIIHGHPSTGKSTLVNHIDADDIVHIREGNTATLFQVLAEEDQTLPIFFETNMPRSSWEWAPKAAAALGYTVYSFEAETV